MSVVCCKYCSTYIDTDYDVECYYFTFEDSTEVQLDFAICDNCKENREITDIIKGMYCDRILSKV